MDIRCIVCSGGGVHEGNFCAQVTEKWMKKISSGNLSPPGIRNGRQSIEMGIAEQAVLVVAGQIRQPHSGFSKTGAQVTKI